MEVIKRNKNNCSDCPDKSNLLQNVDFVALNEAIKDFLYKTENKREDLGISYANFKAIKDHSRCSLNTLSNVAAGLNMPIQDFFTPFINDFNE